MDSNLEENKTKQIWKIRTVKNYPEAHNHIFIGKVLNMSTSFVRLECRTYHFGKSLNSEKDIRVGELGVRIITWNRIEMINELNPEFKYRETKLEFDKHKVIISDGQLKYVVASSYDSRY